MPDVLTALLILHLPALLVCGAFYFAANAITHPALARAVRISAASWLVVLWAIYTLMIVSVETCSGNMLYGYNQCSILPTSLANLSLAGFIFGTGAALLYGTLLILVSIGLEWRHRRAAPPVS